MQKETFQIPREIFEKFEKNLNLLPKLLSKKKNDYSVLQFYLNCTILFSSNVSHCSAMVQFYFCMPEVRGSNPPVAKFLFSLYFIGSEVPILAKISNLQHLSTPMPHPSGGLYDHPEQP